MPFMFGAVQEGSDRLKESALSIFMMLARSGRWARGPIRRCSGVVACSVGDCRRCVGVVELVRFVTRWRTK